MQAHMTQDETKHRQRTAASPPGSRAPAARTPGGRALARAPPRPAAPPESLLAGCSCLHPRCDSHLVTSQTKKYSKSKPRQAWAVTVVPVI